MNHSVMTPQWEYSHTENYVGGKLKCPVITDGTQKLLLLPCNPAKQAQYPNFLGYVKWYSNGTWYQFALTLENGKPFMKQRPNIDPQHFASGLSMLIDLAKANGHVFPT